MIEERKIKAEIERLEKESEDCHCYLDNEEQAIGYRAALRDVLSFVESQPSFAKQKKGALEMAGWFHDNLNRYDESIGLTKDEFINEFLEFINTKV